MSDDDGETTFNIKGLDSLLKALKQKPVVAKVGVLGSKVSRRNDGSGQSNPQTNADIGARHEFGIGVPQRSFLRVPISENLEKYMENTGTLDKETLKDVIKSGSVLSWVKTVAALATVIVGDAFNSGGFGKWPPWAPGYENNTGDILVDTQQLRDSITWEIK